MRSFIMIALKIGADLSCRLRHRLSNSPRARPSPTSYKTDLWCSTFRHLGLLCVACKLKSAARHEAIGIMVCESLPPICCFP